MKKEELIRISKAEALQNYQAVMPSNSGEAIEKYLAPFRELLNKNGNTTMFQNCENGYAWCAVFVHYCMLQAGYNIPFQPIPGKPTMALVRTWYDWAILPENNFWREPSSYLPQPGDLVVFRQLLEGQKDYCHIGVVIEVDAQAKALLSAEGNVVFTLPDGSTGRRTELKQRAMNHTIQGYIVF